MNPVYLKNFFNYGVMLFFNLKTNQKLMVSLIFGATLLASCSGPKKTTVANGSKSRHGNKTENARGKAENVVELDDVPLDVDVHDTPEKVDKRTEKKADKVISTARTFIGTPYKYGGMTRSGMDCSGLLINSFTSVKVNLPRSSEAQSKVGTEIKMNELRPGDLVFFATGNKKNQITHVGLITDVRSKDDVKFIHASSSLGVVETNLFAEYYQKRFRGARRIID